MLLDKDENAALAAKGLGPGKEMSTDEQKIMQSALRRSVNIVKRGRRKIKMNYPEIPDSSPSI